MVLVPAGPNRRESRKKRSNLNQITLFISHGPEIRTERPIDTTATNNISPTLSYQHTTHFSENCKKYKQQQQQQQQQALEWDATLERRPLRTYYTNKQARLSSPARWSELIRKVIIVILPLSLPLPQCSIDIALFPYIRLYTSTTLQIETCFTLRDLFHASKIILSCKERKAQ